MTATDCNFAVEVSSLLPKSIYRPAPERLLWGVAHLVLIASLVFVSVHYHVIVLRILSGLLIGNSLAVMAFLGHEILHGSVIRPGRISQALGGLCFAHCGLLPSVWSRWHNFLHHRLTQGPRDPDCYGPLNGNYRYSKWSRRLERFTPGSGTIYSYAYLFAGFTIHTLFIIFQRDDVVKTGRERRNAALYFAVIPAAWIGLAVLAAGPAGVIYLFLLPLMGSNFIMMSYIATNHMLSPMSESAANPLWTALTVRCFRPIEDLHLQFGYHVEHHVLPGVSPKHARAIRRVLIERWPTLYQELGHGSALRYLYATPRFYGGDMVLANPRTGLRVGTLHSDRFAKPIG